MKFLLASLTLAILPSFLFAGIAGPASKAQILEYKAKGYRHIEFSETDRRWLTPKEVEDRSFDGTCSGWMDITDVIVRDDPRAAKLRHSKSSPWNWISHFKLE